jgi:ubiquinone/menaquinone biosynthesis C-methylase UbiE
LLINYQEEQQLVEPYSKLASIYDELMIHVDYKNWSRFIQKIIQRWHPHAQKILDISCGTANLLLKLDSRKYQLYGSDFSFEMLKVANRKCKSSKASIQLWQGNMIAFQLKQQVDVIISLYDSVNYILNITAWQNMFACVYDSLDNNGLFIFDICTEKNSRDFFHNYYEKKRGNGFYYTRESKYDAENKIHSNRFEIYYDAEKKTFVEYHEQKILRMKRVLDLIKQTHFQFLGAFHGVTFKPGNENSLRIHFVLKKKIGNDSTI